MQPAWERKKATERLQLSHLPLQIMKKKKKKYNLDSTANTIWRAPAFPEN